MIVALGLAFGPASHASWLDDDADCKRFGCVVVHDGSSFDVYDNYNPATGRILAAGSPLVRRASSPVIGVGIVNPVITGSLDEAFTRAPLLDQGAMLGIDTNGDGLGDRFPLDTDNSGFLDAGDTFGAFAIDPATSLVGTATSMQRSLYFASTMDFDLTARLVRAPSGSNLGLSTNLADIGFTYTVTRSGTDDGMSFGDKAQKGNVFRPLGAVTNLAGITAGPTPIMEFRKDISKKKAPRIEDQSVRFDYVFDFSNYDMSMGRGELDFEIEFDIYNR